MKCISHWLVLGTLCLAVPAIASPKDEQDLAAALYQAVAGGDVKRTEALIEDGADVNRPQRPWELTPLLVAVGIDVELTDLLITAGADVNASEREGVTVLMKAVHGGDAGIVRRLLEEPDLDVNQNGPRGNTALTYAVLYGYPGMVEALVEHGADVDVVRNDGTTPKAIARHMHGLAVAMPKNGEAEHHRQDHDHRARSHEQQPEHGHHEGHIPGLGDTVIKAVDQDQGPHDHHRSRVEAVESYSRVLATLQNAGASTEGDPRSNTDASDGGRHGHHHH